MSRKRYLFGCCSLTSQNPEDGEKTALLIKCEGHLHALGGDVTYICDGFQLRFQPLYLVA